MSQLTLDEPRSEAELMARARRLAGWTVGELGAALGVPVPESTRRAKGLAGQLVERFLGASAGSRDAADFQAIGVELKTLPIDVRGRPKESTFVCTIQPNRMAALDFEDSPCWHKLQRVLWVPVEASDAWPLPGRRLGSPILWSPSPAERRVLQDDWERVAARIAEGNLDDIDASLGDALQVRPKAATSAARPRVPDADGAFQWQNPRGFYLRTSFTRQVLRALEDLA
ncbi:MAG: DNA mismatch repair endonuclease MutH [Myxococcota bacterium]